MPFKHNATCRHHIGKMKFRVTNWQEYEAGLRRHGRMKWQATTAYGRRALVETAIGRYEAIIGERLRARSFQAQQTEVAIGCAVLNQMIACTRPKSDRRYAKET